jgi:hypothetical protein
MTQTKHGYRINYTVINFIILFILVQITYLSRNYRSGSHTHGSSDGLGPYGTVAKEISLYVYPS